jgi:ubiquinone/menaquinone biosynthesis C-methylase UbiE
MNSDSQAFKSRDAASYNKVVQAFDHYTDRLSMPLVSRMIALANLKPSHHVLDVGTGTGIVTLQAARWGGHRGKALGIDLSEEMMATAVSKAAQAGLSDRVEFRQMDAEALELPDGAFDVVFSLFALLHFPNPQTALGEMFRVLRPGGRLVIAVGSRPPLFSLEGLLHRVGRAPDLLQMIRGIQMTAPGALDNLVKKHFPESGEPEETHLAHGSLNRTRSVIGLIRKAGFTRLETDWAGNHLVVESPEEFWMMQRTFSSIARKRLDDAPPDKVAAFREEFLRVCHAAQQRGGRLVYPMAAFYVAAERPRV